MPCFLYHLSANGHQAWLHFLAVVNGAAVNVNGLAALKHTDLAVLDVYPGEVELEHMVFLSLVPQEALL